MSTNSSHTFDPTRVYHLDTMAIMRLVTRGLTQTRYENGNPVLVPDMATDLGRSNSNSDFTRREFTLREGLRYEDGAPVRAADVAYAIKAARAGGAVRRTDVRPRLLPRRRQLRGRRDARRQDHRRQDAQAIPFDALYDQWDPETDAGRHQYLDKLVFDFGATDDAPVQKRIIADRGADRTALSYNDILASSYESIEGTQAEKRLVVGASPCTSYLWIDTRKVPLPVRRAIAKAWPLAEENNASGAIPGLTWQPSTTIMPSATPGWLDHDAIGNTGRGNGSPAAAKAMLDDACHLGFELSFYYSSGDDTEARLADVRKKALTKAGFSVKALEAPSALARDLSVDGIRPANLRSGSWCMDWGNGDSVVPAILDGKKANLPGAPVQSFLNVDAVNDEIEQISSLPADKALVQWGRLDAMIMDKYLPVVPLGEGGTTLLHGSKVANVSVDTVGGMPDFTQIYVTG